MRISQQSKVNSRALVPAVSSRNVRGRHRTIIAPHASSRREVLLQTISAPLIAGGVMNGLVSLPAMAEESSSTVYTDPVEKFSITVPAGWNFGEGFAEGNEEKSFLGLSGDRRVLAWFADAADPGRASVSLVITNVQAQFTKMGSFGSPFEFAQGVANQLDESYKLRDKKNAPTSYQRARLADLDPKEIRGAYLFDYTLERVGTDIPTRHCYQFVAMGDNGTYNRLYTLTATAYESEVSKYEKTLLSMLKSFNAPDIKK